jgi:hypothetical protein
MADFIHAAVKLPSFRELLMIIVNSIIEEPGRHSGNEEDEEHGKVAQVL